MREPQEHPLRIASDCSGYSCLHLTQECGMLRLTTAEVKTVYFYPDKLYELIRWTIGLVIC